MSRHEPLVTATVARDATVTPALPPRRRLPSAEASPGPVALLLEQTRTEVLQNIRVPEFLVGTVAFPVTLFLMFGLPNAGTTLQGGTSVGTSPAPPAGSRSCTSPGWRAASSSSGS